MLSRSKLEIIFEYSQFLLTSLEDKFCMNLSYQVGIAHCVNRSGPYDLCCRNTVLSYSNIFVFNSSINCILITQIRLQCTYKLHAELEQTRMEEASFLSTARVRNWRPISSALLHNKSKAIPVQAWTGPDGSRRLRLPDFKTIGTWRR